ncbi:CFI-box-CTERM domain-containing protein [Lysinibacillus capsici]|uniref:CFI-box-CTERM domain-containing protein n=1 Tax=Lysinibacillus capsici TaxID=2115968 RepID=UPI0039FCA60D
MTKIEKTFQVLGKLLTEETTSQFNNVKANQQFQSFLQYVTTEVYPVIDKSSYENKTNFLINLKSAIREIEFIVRTPHLQNKTLVVIEGKKHAVPQWFEQNQMQEYAKFIRQNANIPMILSASEKTTIVAQNTLENLSKLSPDEFRHVNQQLYKEKLDVDQFIQVFYIEAKCPFEHIAFIYLPQFVSRQSEIYKMLHNMAEASIMIEPLHKQLNQYKAPNYAKQRFIIGENVETELSSLILEEVPVLLQQLNKPCMMPAIYDIFTETYQDYLINVTKELAYEQYLVNGLSKDLVTVSDEELEANIISIRNNLKKQLQAKQISHKNLVKHLLQCNKHLMEIEKLFVSPILSDAIFSNKAQLYIAKQALVALEIKDNTGYKVVIERLRNSDSIYTSIIQAYSKGKKEEIVKCINILNELPLNDVTAYISIKYFSVIKSKSLYNKLKKFYHSNYDAEVNLYLGKAAISVSNNVDAQFYFKKAMNLGNSEAAELLLSFINKKNIIEVESIARLLVPEACYLVGKYYLNSKYSKALTFLKIAATFEHFQALQKLAEIEFNRFRKGRNNLPDDRLVVVFSNALKLNHYVHEKERSKEVTERLGKLYYWDGDHRKAINYLSTVDNAECNFMCGKIYQYGNVLSQDLQKSKNYFEKAVRQSHSYAEIELHKVTGWIQSNEVKQSYSSSRSYSSSSSSSSYSSSKSWCFLTTATCIALGKEDNCDEILNYKKYRDEHLRFDDDGRDLIVEYYRIAPVIVEKIDAEPNPKALYLHLYNQYIKVGYDYLQKNDLVNAKKIYIEMVKNLCEKYNVVPFQY